MKKLRCLLIALGLTMLMTTGAAGEYLYRDWEHYGQPETGLVLYTDRISLPEHDPYGLTTVYGLKDASGNIVLPAKYTDLEYAKGNVIASDNFLSDRLITLDGKTLHYRRGQKIDYYRDADVYVISDAGENARPGAKSKSAIFDINFNRLTPESYDFIDQLSGDLFYLHRDSGNGFAPYITGLFKKGVGVTLPVRYKNIGFPQDDLITVRNQDLLYGLYTTDGKQILGEEYACFGGHYGDFIVAAKFKRPEYRREYFNEFTVENNEIILQWGIVDIDGNVVIPFQYDRLDVKNDVFHMGQWNGKTTEGEGSFVGSTETTFYYDMEEPITLEELEKNRPIFSDVAITSYYNTSVRWALEKGVTSGTSATTFSPEKTCTTAEIITFLWRAAGSAEASIENPFRDVSAGDFYYKAALWAYENELVSGELFSGNTPCTRAATVTYLWKLAGAPTASANSFTDVSADADYAQAVAWAVEEGVTAGTGNGTFSPDQTCTRGQIVTFLYKAMA